MKTDRTGMLSALSWAPLNGVLATAACLVGGIVWGGEWTVLTTEVPAPEYQGLSPAACYVHVLGAGFLNLTWGLAFAGVALVWFQARGRGAPAKRIALALSLVFVIRWLEVTLVFLLVFSRFRT